MAHYYPQVIARLQEDLGHFADADAVWCACHNDSSRLQCCALAQISYNLRNAEDHVVGQRVLHGLSVQYRLQLNVTRVRD
jgi:hypothetical protein